MKKVVVVIPYASNNLSEVENISLSQAFKVLGNYDIVLVTPNNIELELSYSNYRQIKVPSNFFGSTEAHNKMLSSVSFYQLFSDYEFMLLYHLDAFVFKDELMRFCDMGYDFIGAPAPKSCWKSIDRRIGNGGFSLRRINSFIDILESKENVMKLAKSQLPTRAINNMINFEDQFVAFCGQIEWRGFKTPDEEVGFQFSIEYNIDGIFHRIDEHVPFGCHRWPRYRFLSWWPLISKFGYTLSDNARNDLMMNQSDFEDQLIMYLLERSVYSEELVKAIRSVIGSSVIRLWGYGYYGKKVLEWMRKARVEVTVIYDKNDGLSDDIRIKNPTIDSIINEDGSIIISSYKFEDEIRQFLDNNCVNTEYLTLSSFIQEIKKELQIETYGERKELL